MEQGCSGSGESARSVKRQKEAVKRPSAASALSGADRALSCGREKFVCCAGEEEFPVGVSCGRGAPADVSCGRGGVSSGRVVRKGGIPGGRVVRACCADGGIPGGWTARSRRTAAPSLPGKTKAGASFGILRLVGWAQRGMIPRPSDYESAALTN